jgi:hypothetical protein
MEDWLAGVLSCGFGFRYKVRTDGGESEQQTQKENPTPESLDVGVLFILSR